MSTTDLGSAHPLVEHLRQIEANEQAKWAVAEEVFTKEPSPSSNVLVGGPGVRVGDGTRAGRWRESAA
ncbi:hypothetical protein, partial [Streptomyces antibioticus]|uniref:hypothetical protein n=1 Tax=Streptomyces antibioticus TaxID=1890 RepID=UPI0033C55A86